MAKSATATDTAQKLGPYLKKREFQKTPEPSGLAEESRPGNLFVVQKHRATRLHWDLRLQIGDVLASWAVPKEPSLDPSVKRLAVHVEDHPLEYGDFEGVIPAGNYGAGKVEIWDRGTWEPESNPESGLKEGKLVFTLFGQRLRGKFALIRLDDLKSRKQDQWLFMKLPEATPSRKNASKPRATLNGKKAGFPSGWSPMLCYARDSPPEGDGWLHEVKWDGYRVLAYHQGVKTTFQSRGKNRLDLPEIEAAFESWPDCVLDGELVVLDSNGLSRFELIHVAMKGKKRAAAVLVLFDLLFLDGVDMRGQPLHLRKETLSNLVAARPSDRIRFSDHAAVDGNVLFSLACKSGLEGLISKKADSPYVMRRSKHWIKSHCLKTLGAVVGGYTLMSGDASAIGALLLGVPGSDGRLAYIGRVGTGFSLALRRSLKSSLEAMQTEDPPFAPAPSRTESKGVRWVEPTGTAVVRYLERSSSGILRQARLDSIDLPEPDSHLKSGRSKEAVATRITHPDRVIDERSGATKADVADYYAAISEAILTFVAFRPLPIIRCPDGLSGTCFFQKAWMRGLKVVGKAPVKGTDGKTDYMQIESREGLLELVQMGAIELHPWGSTNVDLERPDVLIFDLDPGDDVLWKGVVEAAQELRAHLSNVGLASFAKLTGGKGLHVVLPIDAELTWDQAKAFCQALAQAMERANPKRYVATASKALRKGKIFVDYLRNGRGATAVSPYSLRARPGLPVAMPVRWDELESFDVEAFHIRNAAGWLSIRKSDPWEGYLDVKQSLRAAASH